MLTRIVPLVFLSAALIFASTGADAQIWKKAQEAAERALERETSRRADAAVSDMFGIADDAVRCAVSDQACAERGAAEGKQVVYVDKNGKLLPVEQQHPSSGGPASSSAATAGTPAGGAGGPGEGVWANYDFVSGDRVLYYQDFEGTRTGNFPSRLDYLAGTLEVVELGDNKVLRAGDGTSEKGPGGNGCFSIPLPEALPERYTIEFRVRTSDPLSRANLYLFSDGSTNKPDLRCTYPPKTHVYVTRHTAGIQSGSGAKSGVDRSLPPNEWEDVRITADGPYWKMYVNERRVANVPRYEFPRASKLHMFMTVYRYSVFLDDIRIAEGGPRSLYDDLQAAGFVSTTAIRFDSGSAMLKPESTGILADVLDMLNGHDDLRLRIEGHTDSQGSDESNLALSGQRARAVQAWLEVRGIDSGRLESSGRGENEPAASNSTPEGMAQNRRVVFRKP